MAGRLLRTREYGSKTPRHFHGVFHGDFHGIFPADLKISMENHVENALENNRTGRQGPGSNRS
jgi:hypothetical protein